MLEILDEIQQFSVDHEDDLTHLWCNVCHPNSDVSLCGLSLEESDEVSVDDDVLMCIVCDDLDQTHPCPRPF